ncbi:hypothetical protein ABT024_06845 [Streptomyces sp. NPDC002812]|uniref:hypothetical protein n=1 Tax=Streptomyces sp. NPDC002812 TaxID=3154434 RepID=UPI003317E7AD
MARIYASGEQFEEFTGEAAPADIEARLVRASTFLERRIFRYCLYAADATTGMPTNAVVLDAFARAAVAQVRWWAETGDELNAASRFGSVSIGSVSLSGRNTASSAGGREVADEALEALQSPDLTRDVFTLGAVSS